MTSVLLFIALPLMCAKGLGGNIPQIVYLAQFAERWLNEGCGGPDWCGGADINLSGGVDFEDYAKLTDFLSGRITVEEGRLSRAGSPFFAKGANYCFGRYIQRYILNAQNIEAHNGWQFFHDFDPDEIKTEMLFLKTHLNANTFRILTPCEQRFDPYVTYHGFEPWFLADGSINPIYRNRIIKILDIAYQSGIYIQLELFHNIQNSEITESYGYIGPGTLREQFYINYLNSLIDPALTYHPALLAYEVGNEMLVKHPDNYWTQTGHEARVLSFISRMITVIRSLDGNHLVTSGEVVTLPGSGPSQQLWHYPCAEFALINDIDNLNNGAAFSLYELVDYISPHFYTPAEGLSYTAGEVAAYSDKPVVMGEFGYWVSDTDKLQTDKGGYLEDQQLHFEAGFDAIENNHLQGILCWSPFPLFEDLVPGKFEKATWQWGLECRLFDEYKAGDYLVPGDYDGDHRTDMAVFRSTTGRWSVRDVGEFDFGRGHVPVPADYDGDGDDDMAVFNAETLQWEIFGQPSIAHVLPTFIPGDYLVPADYDGDAAADVTVFRSTTSTWHIQDIGEFTFGGQGQIVAVHDYNGDGAYDIGLFDPATLMWHVYGIMVSPHLLTDYLADDYIVPADYDGDGRAERAVYRSAASTWHIEGLGPFTFGGSGQIPAAADYDGDGDEDIAVFDPGTLKWHVYGMSDVPYFVIKRKIYYDDTWELFRADDLTPFPAAVTFLNRRPVD